LSEINSKFYANLLPYLQIFRWIMSLQPAVAAPKLAKQNHTY